MTALGAIIALAPLALGIGTGAQLHQPLAIAVIGGFLVALPLLLIVLPTGLRILYGGKTRVEKIKVVEIPEKTDGETVENGEIEPPPPAENEMLEGFSPE